MRSALIALGRAVISSSTSVMLPVSLPADVQEYRSLKRNSVSEALCDTGYISDT